MLLNLVTAAYSAAFLVDFFAGFFAAFFLPGFFALSSAFFLAFSFWRLLGLGFFFFGLSVSETAVAAAGLRRDGASTSSLTAPSPCLVRRRGKRAGVGKSSAPARVLLAGAAASSKSTLRSSRSTFITRTHSLSPRRKLRRVRSPTKRCLAASK